MLRRLLHTLGLVTRGEYLRVEEKLRATRQRHDRTAERLAQAAVASDELQLARRADAQRSKARVAELETERARRAALASEAADQASRRIAALEEGVRKRDVELAAAASDATRLEQQVSAAIEELRAAREALAAVEVKLNILEGAANVLDSRMRAVWSPDSDGPR